MLQLCSGVLGTSLVAGWGTQSRAQEMIESRVICDESLSWVTPTSAETVCRRIKQAGFNVLMPNVWHGRGTSWPSTLAPWDTDRLTDMARSTPGFDPLDVLIQTARQYEIEVHVWFNVSLRQRVFLTQFYDEGTPPDAFEVHRPAFRDFIVGLMTECVSRYPVQGINLDYIRATGISQSAYCVDDYKRRTGRNLLVDRLAYGVSTAAFDAIVAWQSNAIDDIVRRTSQQVRQVRKNVVVSASAFAATSDLSIEGQNSVKWADDGLIDVLFNMNYDAAPAWNSIRTLQSRMKRPEALVVLCGNYDVVDPDKTVIARDANRVNDLLVQARTFNRSNGVALYIYSLLNDKQVAALSAGVFKVPARPHWGFAAVKTPTDVIVR